MNSTLFEIISMIGIAAAAVSGVLTAAQASLDVFGAIVLGCITAVGGGIIRDLLLGITPPAAFRDPTAVLLAIGVSLTVFVLEYFLSDKFEYGKKRYELYLNIFDSIGLAMFVVIGVNAGYDVGYPVSRFMMIFVGLVTGVGGGILRDIMIGKVPVVLKKHIYALAALLGAILYVELPLHGVPRAVAMYFAIVSILLVRFLATHYKWNMPKYPKTKP